jgi:hypothetical protein
MSIKRRRMMERMTKTADLFVPWIQAQQTFWERWRAAMANGAIPAVSTAGRWNLPTEFWKAAIYGSLEVQLAAAEAWKAWVCANDANIPEMTLGACQTLHFVEDWTRAQMRLWDGWFTALESLAPETATRPAETAQAAAKPRSHEHARPHATPAHAQPHNGVPA